MSEPDERPTRLPPNRSAGTLIPELHEAAAEFLADWLVRRDIDEAFAFVSPRALACVDTDDDAADEVLRGESARELLRDAMEGLVNELGDRNNLTEAIDAVIPWRESLPVREHPFSGDFSVVEMTDRDASVYLCRPREAEEERELVDTGAESRYGTYFSTLFRFKVGRKGRRPKGCCGFARTSSGGSSPMRPSSNNNGGNMHRSDAPLAAIVMVAVLLVAAFPGAAQAQARKPDFSGTWELDLQASDDTESQVLGGAGEDTTRGLTRLERGRLVERLIQLARAIDEIEIAQTERDFRIFDRDDNLRIYYLDGRKHARQTPWGAKLDAVAKWDGQQITVRTTGEEIGEVQETFGMQGRQLVFIVRIKNKNFQKDIVIRNYYDRLP